MQAPASLRTAFAPGGERSILLALVAGTTLLAWACIALWSASPYARYLEHGRWLDGGLFSALCSVVPQGGVIVPALAHASAWLLMIAAMMLPTTWPLLALFGHITRDRPDAARLHALIVGGYALAWLSFGIVAHALDEGVHLAFDASSWLATHAWLVGGLVLAGAGAFQFSALKYRCLERCRSPFGFIGERWRGQHPAREAFRIGFDHGLFCVGCCWALMLLMFVVGMGNLGWMLLIALAMAIEKNVPWGKRISAPLGVGLLAAALVLVVANA